MLKNPNIEILRVMSMIMIIVLHYLYLGGVLGSITINDKNYAPVWLLEAFCFASVNCYVLISGYFLVDKRFDFKKVLYITLETLFYSVLIYVLAGLFGFDDFYVKSLFLGYLYPVTHGLWWFVSVYIVLYLLSPFINLLIGNMTEDQYRLLLYVLIGVFSLLPTVLFTYVDQVGVNKGYSLCWFVCLYLVAGYLKKYGLRFFESRKNCVFTIICCVLLMFLVKWSQIYFVGTDYWDWYSYNSFAVLLISIALFMLFSNQKDKQHSGDKESKLANMWITLGSYTLAVFLIHTHHSVAKHLWNFVSPTQYSGLALWINLVFVTLIIFFTCCFIDIWRKLLFNYLFRQKVVVNLCARVNKIFPAI